jgi:hypothetical protein
MDTGALRAKDFPMRTADTMSDAIAISSPNGRMSKRAKRVAMARLSVALFGPGGATREMLTGRARQPSEAEQCRQQAARLRDLAERGMKPRVFRREAERLEARAIELDSNPRSAEGAEATP